MSLQQWFSGAALIEGGAEWAVEDLGGGQMDRYVG